MTDSQGTPQNFTPYHKFLHSDTLIVDSSDYQSDASSPCYLPQVQSANKQGVLIFGTGLPFRGSDIYLAFIPLAYLHEIENNGGMLPDNAQTDPTSDYNVFYFAGPGNGNASINGNGRCWSIEERDAIPIVKATDNTIYEKIENVCGNTVLKTSRSGAGELSVTHVKSTDPDVPMDRLVMLYHRNYVAQGNNVHTTYCSSGPDEYNTWIGNMGPVFITGDPKRPWIWNIVFPPEQTYGTELQRKRILRPEFVPLPQTGPDDGVDPAGPVCQPNPDKPRETLAGYGTFILDEYTEVSADGKGMNIFFTISRWDGPDNQEIQEILEEAAEICGWSEEDLDIKRPYRVDVFRTTIYPKGHSSPKASPRVSPVMLPRIVALINSTLD